MQSKCIDSVYSQPSLQRHSFKQKILYNVIWISTEWTYLALYSVHCVTVYPAFLSKAWVTEKWGIEGDKCIEIACYNRMRLKYFVRSRFLPSCSLFLSPPHPESRSP